MADVMGGYLKQAQQGGAAPKKKKPGELGTETPGQQAPQQGMTFAQMQRDGMARPAPPMFQPGSGTGAPPPAGAQQAQPAQAGMPPRANVSAPGAPNPNQQWDDYNNQYTQWGQQFGGHPGDHNFGLGPNNEPTDVSRSMPMAPSQGPGEGYQWTPDPAMFPTPAAPTSGPYATQNRFGGGPPPQGPQYQPGVGGLQELIQSLFPQLPQTYGWQGGWQGQASQQVTPRPVQPSAGNGDIQFGINTGNRANTMAPGGTQPADTPGVGDPYEANTPRQAPTSAPQQHNQWPFGVPKGFPQPGGQVPGQTPNPYAGGNTGNPAPPSPFAGPFQDWMNGGQSAPNQYQPDPQMDAMTRQLLQQLLGNPNPYNSDLVVGSYNRLDDRIREQGDLGRQYINEDAARRGVGDSTIPVGRLGDLEIGQTRARTDLAHNLLEDAAKTQGGASSSALSAAMGYGNQQAQTFGMNQQAQQQWFDQTRARLQDAFGAHTQQFMEWLQTAIFNHQVDADEIDFWMRQQGL